LLLTFIVPILFFSIFAWIFGSRGGSGSTPQLKIVASDSVENEETKRAFALLKESGSLRFHEDANIDRSKAEMLVRRGLVSAAIVWENKDDRVVVKILTDSFDQVAGQVLVALVQKASLTAQSEMMPQPILPFQSSENFQQGNTLAVSTQPKYSNGENSEVTPASSYAQMKSMSIPEIAVVDVLGAKKNNPIVAMYAAGIAVMFLLFSATTASGALLEEKENSTLERLLCSRMTMDHLLMGKWCYLVLIGCLQTTLMFVSGALFFKLNLWDHIGGFAVMTFVTAGAAASFALMLAALCRTRTQLGWVSTILILSMSALGGSMVPRYLMSENIQRFGQLTFNAWALDGYNKIFWRELPLSELKVELAVLVISGLIFIILARLFATRWDRS
jgi:ABC-2 type transport system permease protein